MELYLEDAQQLTAAASNREATTTSKRRVALGLNAFMIPA